MTETNNYKEGYNWTHCFNYLVQPFEKSEEDKNIFDRIKECDLED